MGRIQKSRKHARKNLAGEAAPTKKHIQQGRADYQSRIGAILNELDRKELDEADLQRTESSLDKLATLYQDDETLGAERYKLYAAQAKIEFERGDSQRAQAFIEEAVRVKGSTFALADDLLSSLRETKNTSLLAKLNHIANWQAALIIAIVGLLTYVTGLGNPFQGDDLAQVVNNPLVHSMSHIPSFFNEGTFYEGIQNRLTGTYYRPLMTTVFSVLYSLFGAHTFPFHLLQLLLCIGSAIMLYLIFRRILDAVLSLGLAMIFLVHPLNSQVVFAIPSMQDALYFFFGTLAIWSLQRHTSTKGMVAAVSCLFISLLSKEAGLYFVFMAFVYLLLFNKERVRTFFSLIWLPILIWGCLRIHAVGFNGNPPLLGPIDSLNLMGRLQTAPSIILFYLTKVIFPWRLASGYYWAYPTFSVEHVLLPLVVDIAVAVGIIFLSRSARRRLSPEMYHAYLFFAIWAGVGLVGCLQIAPLDMTVCETWFYFSFAGLLGMVSLTVVAFQRSIRPSWLIAVLFVLIGTFGIRTAIRGTDWSSSYTLAAHDVSSSPQDYAAYNVLGENLTMQGNYVAAERDEQRSVAIYPSWSSLNNYGVDLLNLGEYANAMSAFKQSSQDITLPSVDESLAMTTLLTGNLNDNKSLILNSLRTFPNDGQLWAYLGLLEDKDGDNMSAKAAFQRAAAAGFTPAYATYVNNNQPFDIDLGSINKSVHI